MEAGSHTQHPRTLQTPQVEVLTDRAKRRLEEEREREARRQEAIAQAAAEESALAALDASVKL